MISVKNNVCTFDTVSNHVNPQLQSFNIPSSACSSNSVNVIFNVLRKIIIHNHAHAQTTQIGNKKFNFLFRMVRSILGGKRGGGGFALLSSV